MNQNKQKNLALYVHDFKLEVGHSNSLIELIRNAPSEYINQFSSIEVVSFTVTPLKELFPDFKGTLKWSKVPFPGIKPMLFKSIFFQIWCFFHNHLVQPKNSYRIGIGICNLMVDAVSIQFIHHNWTKKGLEQEKNHPFRKIYKIVLFTYFELCERYLFSKKKVKFFSPARFLTEFLQEKFPGIQASTVYSGVNLERFILPTESKHDLLRSLIARYPILNGLDVTKPVFLFIGAYERKGLPEAIELVSTIKDSQFIVIGSPSLGKEVNWPASIKVFPIRFTKEVPSFYALSDVFVFPTIYEPFGLVLFEALAMGLPIITRRNQVGASELMENLDEVYFCDKQEFKFPSIQVMSPEQKMRLRDARIQKLGNISWKKAANEMAGFLK